MEENKSSHMNMRDRQARFLRAYKENYANVTKSCEEIGIDRGTFYLWKKKKSFIKRLERVNAILVDNLKTEAINRAYTGSDTMLKFLLTKLKAEEFGDKLELGLPKDLLNAIFSGLPADFRKEVCQELDKQL